MIIGGSPGGGFDTLARAIARHIGKQAPTIRCRRPSNGCASWNVRGRMGEGELAATPV
jgi:hypothetical protein